MLREARSTPYISSVPEDMNKKHLAGIFRPNCTSSVENFPVKMKELGIQFNTGSSSSTDLSNFVQFYNDAGDTEVMNKWMGLYAENKAMNCLGAASTSSSALQERRTRNHSDSDECVSQMSTLHKQLSQCSSASRNSSTPEANNVQTNCKYSVNRSMDVLSETHPNTRAPK
ncbi:hypothetical protein Ddc_04980 [Ditylenchus destructor]|nr:hypothetical protein Ddc_04980 [Ditylenchus destructor]